MPDDSPEKPSMPRSARIRPDPATREQLSAAGKSDVEYLHQQRIVPLAFFDPHALLGEKGLAAWPMTKPSGRGRSLRRLAQLRGVRTFDRTFFNEVTLSLPRKRERHVRAMADMGVLGGVSLGRLYPGESSLANAMVVAVTETVTDDDVGALAKALEEVMA